MIEYDVAVIGAGPAGLAAAISAKHSGAEKVVVIERDFRMGGILEQCIHMGFGLKYFGEELSGPEYAGRFIEMVRREDITVMLNTMVLSIDGDRRVIKAVNGEGLASIKAGAIVLAMGCRERTRAQVATPGTRPAGIFTAGTAQRFINVQNELVGNRAVIVGSGDIGMIMARRLTLEGIKVEAVIEILPYLAGLTRNKVQCLEDYGIPLYLSHTVTDIKGKYRVNGITAAQVDENLRPVAGTEFNIDCDTVLYSVGLIPENEISKTAGVRLDPVSGGPIVDHNMQTSVRGIFSCGNVLHVNDLVDNVSLESELAGRAAAMFSQGLLAERETYVEITAGANVKTVTPQRIAVPGPSSPGSSSPEPSSTGEDARAQAQAADGEITVYFRVAEPAQNVEIQVSSEGKTYKNEKRAFVNPGEMESIRIDAGMLKGEELVKLVINAIKR